MTSCQRRPCLLKMLKYKQTVNYSFASNFVDFALSSVTEHAKKLDAWLGLEQVFGKVKRLAFGFFKMVT